MPLLTGKTHTTGSGEITYRVNTLLPDRLTLVFLHGLTVDGRLFAPQARAFHENYNLLIWDAPAHGHSRPFPLNFSYMDMAVWLHEILEAENIRHPVLIGHSMGGYIAQCFMEKYPGQAAGFISIDSAPLQRHYLTDLELWLLEHIEPVYHAYPWRALLANGAWGNATTRYGQRIVKKIFSSYGKEDFCRLAGHGYRQLAAAYRADLSYEIDRPALLICGEKDRAGSAKRYNKRWADETGLPIRWIKNAGHCSGLDAPEAVNDVIRAFLSGISSDYERLSKPFDIRKSAMSKTFDRRK